MFMSWWLIALVVAGVALLLRMVSRLANEVDKLETALEESRGKMNSLSQRADKLKQANLRMTESLMQVRSYMGNVQSSKPE
ncbi:hypothetical protein D3C75_446270 [compost metagenome]|jgi:Sec-independent protein translocase protein TatA|uniref:Uncharacterized protein n=1 Tax=Silvania hatchlandensis TaxID=2926469 RepID=A0A9J6QCG2_9ENTR|nr:hypothetical protein [Silvania hatchlandensis]MCU6666149.1 hypothetical protein [Silvania hatchlandensis]